MTRSNVSLPRASRSLLIAFVDPVDTIIKRRKERSHCFDNHGNNHPGRSSRLEPDSLLDKGPRLLEPEDPRPRHDLPRAGDPSFFSEIWTSIGSTSSATCRRVVNFHGYAGQKTPRGRLWNWNRPGAFCIRWRPMCRRRSLPNRPRSGPKKRRAGRNPGRFSSRQR